MLIVHPKSNCDVCLESYSNGRNVPHNIACGHVFCLPCLRSLNRPTCPLCRTSFDLRDVRRIHIDRSPRPADQELPASPESVYVEIDTAPAREFQDAITRIVRQGDSMTAVREKIDEIRTWLKGQTRDQHPDLRASFLLLYRYTELQRQDLDLQREVKQAQADLERSEQLVSELRAQLASEREAASSKYETLLRTSSEEKSRAITMEKSKRDYAERMEREWKMKFNESNSECLKLKDEVERLSRNPLPPPPKPKDDRFFYLSSGNSSASDLVAKPGYWSTHLTPASYTLLLAQDEPLPPSPAPTTPGLTDDEVFDALCTDIETEKEVFTIPHRKSAPPTMRKAPVQVEDPLVTGLSHSLPRSQVQDPFMTPRRPTRERSNTHSGTRRMASPARRRTTDTVELEPRERLRGQLYDLRGQLADLLDRPLADGSSARADVGQPSLPRARSSQSVQAATMSPRPERRRKMSVPDATPSASDPPPPPPPPPPPLPSFMPPPVLVHASAAAWAAERLRSEMQAYKTTPMRITHGTPLRDVTTLGDVAASPRLPRGSVNDRKTRDGDRWISR